MSKYYQVFMNMKIKQNIQEVKIGLVNKKINKKLYLV